MKQGSDSGSDNSMGSDRQTAGDKKNIDLIGIDRIYFNTNQECKECEGAAKKTDIDIVD